ncbi:DNA-binding transcriptional regulator, MerR family [Pseudomonas sp. NFACC02]|uniref:MerR family transcriptional regulator n=1 Tax=Pseudomonas sp. NFACC02 TaxID=1566250 RepID=UPI0008BCC290|nr:MerR family transcriptional regulator [Pseudomonas sp. NFACC02]SEQ47177.1 DNA-binding transcriptional regulator, MerR family [Pseudomonas sp. NFACC02]
MTHVLPDPSVVEGHPQALLPIREVSRLTGVNPVTLRAWERRYGLIVPTRTESGHRLYSLADVETVRTIMGWIERGVAVGKVGKILAGTRDLDGSMRGLHSVIDSAEQQAWQLQLRQAVNDFDECRLDQLYGQIFSTYPLPVVFEDVVMPVWREFTVRHDAFGQTSEWLFLDSFLRARTLQRVQLTRSTAQQRVLLAAMPEGCRELELWVAGVLMATPQIAVSVLAPGQPLEELSLVCGKMKPDALILFSTQVPAIDVPKRLVRLGLGLECPVLVAGDISDAIQESLAGTAIGCLGSDGLLMQRRLQRFLAGRMDT